MPISAKWKDKSSIHIGFIVFNGGVTTFFYQECIFKENTDRSINQLTGIILCIRPANERGQYTLTPSLFGWAQTQNDPEGVLVLTNVASAFVLDCETRCQGLKYGRSILRHIKNRSTRHYSLQYSLGKVVLHLFLTTRLHYRQLTANISRMTMTAAFGWNAQSVSSVPQPVDMFSRMRKTDIKCEGSYFMDYSAILLFFCCWRYCVIKNHNRSPTGQSTTKYLPRPFEVGWLK